MPGKSLIKYFRDLIFTNRKNTPPHILLVEIGCKRASGITFDVAVNYRFRKFVDFAKSKHLCCTLFTIRS